MQSVDESSQSSEFGVYLGDQSLEFLILKEKEIPFKFEPF